MCLEDRYSLSNCIVGGTLVEKVVARTTKTNAGALGWGGLVVVGPRFPRKVGGGSWFWWP